MIAPIGTAPLNESGTATRSGLADVPLPFSVGSCNIDDPPLASIVPATVSFDVGESVPMPTFPNLSSKIFESPRVKVFDPNTPVHLEMRPEVPRPVTGSVAAG